MFCGNSSTKGDEWFLDKNKIIDLMQDYLSTMYKCLFTRIIASNK